MGKPKHTQEYIVNFLKERNIELLSEYKNSISKIQVRCAICGHMWCPLFNNINSGRRNCLCRKAKTKKKTQQTNLERYGSLSPSGNEEVKKKTKQTFLKKYGVEHPLKRKDILEKQRQTNLERYGVENVSNSEEINNKRKKIFIEKYGSTSPLGNKEVQKKIKQTNLQKLGVEYPLQNKKVQEKQIETNIEKYGARRPCQNAKIASKNSKSQTNSFVLFHWKTNEELVCVGSYEKKVVEYLNGNKIDFWWQQYTFAMPNDKTYRPDLYLVQDNKWVEVKGYFRKDAQEKWSCFSENRSNVELWDKERLQEIGII